MHCIWNLEYSSDSYFVSGYVLRAKYVSETIIKRNLCNIKMDLREVGFDPRDWIDHAEDRDQWRAYARAVMKLRVP